jgi:hypothetical protein
MKLAWMWKWFCAAVKTPGKIHLVLHNHQHPFDWETSRRGQSPDPETQHPSLCRILGVTTTGPQPGIGHPCMYSQSPELYSPSVQQWNPCGWPRGHSPAMLDGGYALLCTQWPPWDFRPSSLVECMTEQTSQAWQETPLPVNNTLEWRNLAGSVQHCIGLLTWTWNQTCGLFFLQFCPRLLLLLLCKWKPHVLNY